MSLSYFQQLPIKAQVTIVKAGAKLIAKRQEPDYSVSLFIVRDYYVELYTYDDETKPEKVIAFKNLDQLSPYLEQIDIAPLLKESLGSKK